MAFYRTLVLLALSACADGFVVTAPHVKTRAVARHTPVPIAHTPLLFKAAVPIAAPARLIEIATATFLHQLKIIARALFVRTPAVVEHSHSELTFNWQLGRSFRKICGFSIFNTATAAEEEEELEFVWRAE